MATKFHLLTADKDKITGGGGKDIFNGPLTGSGMFTVPTLSSEDVLNGGGGRDTISADLDGSLIAPWLRNIEVGIFTHPTAESSVLNLAHAQQMKTLKLQDIQSNLIIENVQKITSFGISGYNGNTLELDASGKSISNTLKMAFADSLNLVVDVERPGHKPPSVLDVTLSSSQVFLHNDVDAAAIHLHSKGGSLNGFGLYPQNDYGNVHSLTVDGAGDLNLSVMVLYGNLHVYDASGATGAVDASIGGKQLNKVAGSAGNDSLYIDSLGGTRRHAASVKLGAGDDVINLAKGVPDNRLHEIYGGNGLDTAIVDGAVKRFSGIFHDFEGLNIYKPTWNYDLKGAGFVDIRLMNEAGEVTLNHVASGASVSLFESQDDLLAINVEGAEHSKTDELSLSLYGGVTIGGIEGGLQLAGLSNLEIHSYGNENVLYLESAGTETDPVAISIGGDAGLTLRAAAGAYSFISHLTITNTKGVDVSALELGAEQAFLPEGATITGGIGDDILVGGVGNDTINTGGGNNTVYSSHGIDHINLGFNTGADVLIIRGILNSPVDNPDIVTNFSALDTIDVDDLVTSISFGGNFSSQSAGLASLSAAHSVAFFRSDTHTLFVDVNHDGAIDVDHDMAIKLEGVTALSSWNITA